MTAAPPHPFLTSQDAQLLQNIVGNQVDRWLAGAVSCTDANAFLFGVKSVFSRALSDAARRWNMSHDRLRRLPPELRDLCMLLLPTASKCNLGFVCSFWRDTIAARPALWTDVDLVHQPRALDPILRRSGQLPVRVRLLMQSRSDWASANDTLRPHAHRLRRLRIGFDDSIPVLSAPPLSLLNYPAPALCELILEWKAGYGYPQLISVPRDACAGAAPKLRALTLRDVGLPATCPALCKVERARIEGRYVRGVENLYTVLPSLRALDLVGLPDDASLPMIPPGHPLAQAGLAPYNQTFGQLQDGGYLNLPNLLVVSYLGHLEDAARSLTASAPHSMLAIDKRGATRLILRRDGGREAEFATSGADLDDIRGALCEPDSPFRDIARLVLPLHPNQSYSEGCPLLRREVGLPRLISLQIRCGRPTWMTCSLLDPALQRGVIAAPLLTRLELTAEADCPSTLISVSHLTHFIENHLRLGDIASLELFIDTTHGVRLEGEASLEDDLAHLRSLVGVIHM